MSRPTGEPRGPDPAGTPLSAPPGRPAGRAPVLGPGARPRGLPRGHRAAGPAVAADRATRAVGPRGPARVALRRRGGAAARRPGEGRARPAPADPPSGRPAGRLRPPLGLRRRPAGPGRTVVVDPDRRRRPAHRALGRLGRRAARRADLPGLHARRARRLLRAARPPAGPRAPAPGPADVWECSHLGGDRFAANVLVLPHGFYYGQVPGDGAELVAAHERGEVALPWLRGRAGSPRRARPRSSRPARSWASSASTTCRSPTSGRSPARAPRSSAGR